MGKSEWEISASDYTTFPTCDSSQSSLQRPQLWEHDIDFESGKSENSDPSFSSKSIRNRINITLGPVYVQRLW